MAQSNRAQLKLRLTPVMYEHDVNHADVLKIVRRNLF